MQVGSIIMTHTMSPLLSESFAFVTTVEGNKEGFTKQQVKGAELARTLYTKLGYPSHRDFRWIVQSNQIHDCPVTVEDVDTALKIWGKNIAALKGKTTRSKPIHVARDFVKVPRWLLNLHKDVYLLVSHIQPQTLCHNCQGSTGSDGADHF